MVAVVVVARVDAMREGGDRWMVVVVVVERWRWMASGDGRWWHRRWRGWMRG